MKNNFSNNFMIKYNKKMCDNLKNFKAFIVQSLSFKII